MPPPPQPPPIPPPDLPPLSPSGTNIPTLLLTASLSSNIPHVTYLLHPLVSPHLAPSATLHRAAYDGGAAVYSIYLSRFPHAAKERDALSEAVVEEDVDMVHMLLKRGVNPQWCYWAGRSVLDEARDMGNREIVRVLEAFGAAAAAHAEGIEAGNNGAGRR